MPSPNQTRLLENPDIRPDTGALMVEQLGQLTSLFEETRIGKPQDAQLPDLIVIIALHPLNLIRYTMEGFCQVAE
jgi:hypothetical protein